MTQTTFNERLEEILSARKFKNMRLGDALEAILSLLKESLPNESQSANDYDYGWNDCLYELLKRLGFDK